MWNKELTGYLALLLLIFSIVCLQQYIIHKLYSMLAQTKTLQTGYRNYVLNTFNQQNTSAQINVADICKTYLKDSSFVVFLPKGLCRSCFSSLLIDLQDSRISGEKVCVISDGFDYTARAECKARNMDYLSIPLGIDDISGIVIVRNYRGFMPVQMLYNQSSKNVFQLFISDDENLLPFLYGKE
ncbi:MAG: hypothetical protein J5939_03145 [Bacteroidales bacterium]|nr:hypothetical protein [Bacteroidales bacterium]